MMDKDMTHQISQLSSALVFTVKNAGLFLLNFRSNMDKPRHRVTFLNDIFNPMTGFIHI